jgi:hypothetical protein
MVAQLLGITLGLSISGAIFVNLALKGLQVVLPEVPRSQLQSALTGTSGGFFNSLPENTQLLALNALVNALKKVCV